MLCKKSLETVSIALPTFNGERYISEQLESFANQSCCLTSLLFVMMARLITLSVLLKNFQ